MLVWCPVAPWPRPGGAPGGRAPATPVARWLILGTMAVESDLSANRQLRRGPARGLVQMEPATALDIGVWLRATFGRRWYGRATGDEILEAVTGLRPSRVFKSRAEAAYHLETSLALQVFLSRLHYYRVPEPLPGPLVAELGAYWKSHYNTAAGAGTAADFTDRFVRHFGSHPEAEAHFSDLEGLVAAASTPPSTAV